MQRPCRHPTKGSTPISKTEANVDIKSSYTRLGARVSINNLEYRLRGRTLPLFGWSSSEKYAGGCIFMNHASKYMHIEHQLGLSASETIIFKHNFERLAMDHGLVIYFIPSQQWDFLHQSLSLVHI